LEDPLTELSATKQIPKLFYQEFTRPALSKAINDLKGKFLWAADEFASVFLPTLTPSDREWRGFRGALNSYYSRKGTAKMYASKPSAVLSTVDFNISGVLQPQPYCSIIDKLISIDDGLIDRFLQVFIFLRIIL